MSPALPALRWTVPLLLGVFLLSCALRPGPTDPPLAPIQSPNDDRSYRYLVLDNGLRALLVSDPDTVKAAASLDVHVGSASNPGDRGGLAHFLEHMLFLGTDKYPDSGEYARFISEHGGSRNAYAAFEHTNYFFDVDAAHLAAALDRFGQFFISPRFDPEYVEREVNAVEAEYRLGLKTDARRSLDVLRETVNPEHPYAVLGVGTRDTLADRPMRPVREELIEFYRRYYSANLMTLAVVGREDLDSLRRLVESIFSAVPNREVEIEDIAAPLYAPGSLPMEVRIRPVASRRQLQLSFPMPDYSDRYRGKPLRYISNLIGHEGRGSLLSLLKQEGWAEGLSAGTGIAYRGGSAFDVNISLTEAGLDNRERILRKFFEYVRLLQLSGPRRSAYEEQARLAALAFRFRPDVQAIRYVVGLANDMHLFRPEDILRGNYLMDDYDPALIAEILDEYLTPENVAVTTIAPGLRVERESRYYATPYSARTLGPGEGDWRVVADEDLDPRLRLPEPNEFIARNVELVEPAADNPPVPALVEAGERLRVWYRRDGDFRVPRGAMYANFRNARVNDTPAHAAAARLYVRMLRDAVNEFTYPAWLAGLDFRIFTHARGISLKIDGYDDRQLTLLDRIVRSIAGAELDNRRFDDIRDDLVRDLENVKTRRAFRQVVDDARRVLLSGQWDERDLIRELKALDPPGLQAYADGFWAGAQVDVMLNGNYAEAAVAGVRSALAPLLSHELPSTPPLGRVVKLRPGDRLVYRAEVEHDDSVLFRYLQAPGDSMEERALAALTARIVDADYFEELRTEQQLGYVVSAIDWLQREVPGLAFLVQSPSAPAPALERATSEFLLAMGETGRVTPEQFERHRDALLVDILRPHENIVEQSEYFWREIARRELGFDTRARMAAAVRAVTPGQWLAWYRRVVIENPASLAVVAPGRWETLPAGDLLSGAGELKKTRELYTRE